MHVLLRLTFVGALPAMSPVLLSMRLRLCLGLSVELCQVATRAVVSREDDLGMFLDRVAERLLVFDGARANDGVSRLIRRLRRLSLHQRRTRGDAACARHRRGRGRWGVR